MKFAAVIADVPSRIRVEPNHSTIDIIIEERNSLIGELRSLFLLTCFITRVYFSFSSSNFSEE